MSSSDLITIYQMATVNLYRIGGPILIILGSIGVILNLSVFTQKAMRQNPGSIYFIAFNIGDFLLLWFSFFPFIYRYISGIDPSILNLFYCRLRIYLLNVLIIMPRSYLILASIDRTLVTSRNALTRQRSTRRLAFWSIGVLTVVWFLYYIHIWFHVNIQSPAPGFTICFFDPGAYATFMSYSTMTMSGFLPPFLMVIFGLKTLRNFRRPRIQPMTNEYNITRISFKDRQLCIMLLFEILISVVCSSVGSIIYVYTQRTSDENKTLEQQALDYFLLDFSVSLEFLQACLNFYSNFIVSKTFRKNIKKRLVKIVLPFCRLQSMNHQQTMPSTIFNTADAGVIIRLHTISAKRGNS